jgi:hypothetical protein
MDALLLKQQLREKKQSSSTAADREADREQQNSSTTREEKQTDRAAAAEQSVKQSSHSAAEQSVQQSSQCSRAAERAQKEKLLYPTTARVSHSSVQFLLLKHTHICIWYYTKWKSIIYINTAVPSYPYTIYV